MAGFLSALKGIKEEKGPPVEYEVPQQSKCIRIGKEDNQMEMPNMKPCPTQGHAEAPLLAANGRSRQAETSAEVRLISALVFSLYQIRISDPAVLCTATAFCLTRDCPRWRVKLLTAPLAKPNLPRLDNVLIVQTSAKHPIYIDFEWRERYRLKRTIPIFDQWFNSVSPVMVAPEASLVSQIRHNSLHCRNCFLALGMEVPPWRRPEPLISAYLSGPEIAIDVRPLCGYLLETLPDSGSQSESCEHEGQEPCNNNSCPLNGRIFYDSDVDSSDEDCTMQPKQVHNSHVHRGAAPSQVSLAKTKPGKRSSHKELGVSGRSTDEVEVDVDGNGSSGEYDNEISSLDDQEKYDAPPVLTALTETYKNGKHTYMCVEYSQAMKADAARTTDLPCIRAVGKGNADSRYPVRASTADLKVETAVDDTANCGLEARKEVAMADLLTEPDMAFLLDLNVQQLVEQTGTNPECVIKAVPPYPFSKEEIRAARKDQPKKRKPPVAPSTSALENMKTGKGVPVVQFSGRQTVRSPHRTVQKKAENYAQKDYVRSLPPQKLQKMNIMPLNSMPQRPLVWAHVDNRPIYAPVLTDDLRQLLLAHVPSSYIPNNQSFSQPMYHLMRDSQYAMPWPAPTVEDYAFEKTHYASPPTAQVSGLTEQLSRASPSPARRFGFWW